MSHIIDLKNYQIHTDIIVESYDKNDNIDGINYNEYKIDGITIEETIIDKKGEQNSNKKIGNYRTITFDDITDKDNFKKVENVFIDVFKSFLKLKNISKDDKCLVIGLGNEKSTPDSLGPLTINGILVTKHLYNLGEVDNSYRNVSSFKPNVTGVTGIETSDLVKGIVDKTKPDFVILIDALSSTTISHLNKTIQISDSGIFPGSGIGNNRNEISKDTLNIPVIVIGIPTVVNSSIIVLDTLKYLLKQISYKKENQNNNKLKFIPNKNQNYLNHHKELSKEEKKQILGMIGNLDNDDLKTLIDEVLSPINYNLMVTVKEIDFIIEKLALLLSNGINKSLHEGYNTTNY